MASEPLRAPTADARIDRDAGVRVGRNFSFRVASQVINSIINVIGMVLLGNALNASDYGGYAFYYALVSLISSLADGGVGIIITREISRDVTSGPRLLGDGLMVKSAISAAIMLLVLVIGFSTLDPARAALLALVTATALVDFSQDSSVWVLRAHERLNLEAVLLILSQVIWLGALALAVTMKAGLPVLLGAASFAFLVRMVVGAVIVSRLFYRPVFRPDFGRLRGLLLQGLPFGLAMFGVVLYGRIGLLTLKALSTPADVAYYNVSYLLSQPFGFIASALSIAAFPMLSRHASGDERRLRRVIRRTYRFQVLLTPPMTVGLFLLAEPIVAILFHKGTLQPAAAGLRIMSLALMMIFLNVTSRYVLTAIDRQGAYLRSIVAGLIASVVLGLLLVPPLGFRGACYATIGGELAICIVCQRALSRYLTAGNVLEDLVRPVIAAVGMGLVVFALRGIHLGLVVAVGCATYFALLLLIQGISSDDLKAVGRLYSSLRLPGAKPVPRAELHF